jgi:flagellar hook assembly protein FlgD
MSSLPKRVRLTITDMQTGVTSDLRSAAGIKVALRAGTVTRFRVVVATDATRKLAVSYLRSEPGGRSSGAYSYRLGLTQDAEVDAQIVTLSGKSIQTIAAGRATAGNTAKLVWNGRNTDGSSVPVGPYKLIVTVRGTDGSSVTETRTISVVR